MITKLTLEQENKLSVYREKWLNKIFNYELYNSKSEESMIKSGKELYKFCNLKEPVVLIASSPLTCQLMANLIQFNQGTQVKIGNQIEDQIENQVKSLVIQIEDQIENQVKSLIWNQVRNQVGIQVRNQVGIQVGTQIEDQIENQVKSLVIQIEDQIENQVKSLVENKVWDQIWSQVRNQVRNQVGTQVRNQVGTQVEDQVWNQVEDQVGIQVGTQVGIQVEDQVENQIRNQVWDQIGSQVRDQVRNQVGIQVGTQVGIQVGTQIKDQIEDQIGTQVWDQIRSQIGIYENQIGDQIGNLVKDKIWDQAVNQIGSKVWDQIGGQVGNLVRDQIGIQIITEVENQKFTYFNFSSYINYSDFGWCSFYDYFNIEFNIIEKELSDNFSKIIDFVEHSFMSIQFEELLIVSKYPNFISRNSNNDLHNTKRSAISFEDGYEQFYVNGRSISKKIFEKSQKLTSAKEIFQNENNEDIKAAVITIVKENFGNEGLLEMLDAIVIDEQIINHPNNYTEKIRILHSKQRYSFLQNSRGELNQSYAWIEMTCPSTGSVYLIDTCPTFTNALECAKWHRPNEIPVELEYSWISAN